MTDKRIRVRIKMIRMAVAVAAAIAPVLSLGAGTAAAQDPFAGKSYADAAAKVAGRGGIAVISTVVGSQLATEACIVQSWRQPSFAGDNFDHPRRTYLFALNCSAKLAHPGLPGNSLASQEGRAEKLLEDRAARFNEKPARCEQNLESCQRFCDANAGKCSAEVLALF